MKELIQSKPQVHTGTQTSTITDAAWCQSVCPHLFLSDRSILSFQAGDAGDPELPDALAVSADSVEESDRHVHSTAVPQHGKEPVLHSRWNHRELMQTPLCQRKRSKRCLVWNTWAFYEVTCEILCKDFTSVDLIIAATWTVHRDSVLVQVMFTGGKGENWF